MFINYLCINHPIKVLVLLASCCYIFLFLIIELHLISERSCIKHRYERRPFFISENKNLYIAVFIPAAYIHILCTIDVITKSNTGT